jgi:hypothetical protein
MNLPSKVIMLFGLAVAAISAAVGDIVVESLSNHGVFGPGHFTDGSTCDVAPVTIIGVVLFAAFLFRRIQRAIRRISATLSVRAVLHMLPAVFTLHIALLFVMETLEQQIVLGHLLGGTVWLGAPAVASVLLHLVITMAIAFLALAAVRFLEPHALQFIRTLLASIIFPPSAPVVVARSARTAPVSRWMVHHEVAKRGPPAAYLSM